MAIFSIGFSAEHDATTIIEMLTAYSGDGQGPTNFETLFGVGPLEPGAFEVYGVEDTNGGFSPEELEVLMPFTVPEDLQLFHRDMSRLKAVFFVRDPTPWSRQQAAGIIITDRIDVERFDYE